MKKKTQVKIVSNFRFDKFSMISLLTNLILISFLYPVLMKVILFQWKRIGVAQLIYISLLRLFTRFTQKLFRSRKNRLLLRRNALVLYSIPMNSMNVYSYPRFFQDQMPSSIFVPPKRLHLMILELTSLLSTKHLSR